MQIFGKHLSRNWLVGDPESFSLEERIFNTFCIIAFISMCFEVPFNLYIDLKVPAGLCAFGIFISAALYYLSRFKRKSSLGIILFGIVCNITFAINYFFNSGIFGPNLLLFALAFLLIIAIIPKTQFKIWIPINVLLVLLILTVEYINPQLAKYAYNSEFSKTLDFGITYFVVVVITYFAISYIRENYEYERGLVIKKNRSIEEQNSMILKQNNELEKLNSEKDKLFSIVSHDIRTPLNSIQSYLELLSATNLKQADRLGLEQRLLEITRDTSSMLTNILSWSKTQMEGTHAELIPIKVKDFLINGLNIEKNISIKKGVTFEIVCDEDLTAIADQNMFQLVVRNLVNNAIKFTASKGLVLVKALKKGEECIVIIKDNGLGMDPQQQEMLFKLKASSTYGTNNERGIGLGLLLCKEFTDLQGGKIWFESKIGEGTTFYLAFPLK